MASGLDTDSIIQELMSVQRSKLTKIENKQTTLTWKQEKWKELNTKLYALYTGELSKLKTQGSYLSKKVSSSNENAVTATATNSASIGSHTLEVKELASAQYVTSGKIDSASSVTTKLKDLGMTVGTVINIKKNNASESTTLEVDSDTTIEDFIKKCKEAGINANFDEKQKRLFISSKASGKDEGFTIDTAVSSRVEAKEALDQMIIVDAIGAVDPGDPDQVAREKEIVDAYEKLKTLDVDTWNNLKNGTGSVDGEYQAAFDIVKDAVGSGNETALIDNMDKYVNEVITSDADNALKHIGLSQITDTTTDGTDAASGMTLVSARNAVIVLDGAELEESSNNFSVNGLTLDLKGKTDGEVKLNVTNDVDTVYNMVKDFVKKYNEILKEMNSIYSAKSARGYDPLTDEEKEAMTDDQIEKWENKIKDSLLRRDSTVSSITGGMRNAMLSTVKVDGKSYSLASIGIVTSSDYTEKGILHIYGDEEGGVDSKVTLASGAQELKKALEENPDIVMEVLSTAGKALYDDMTKKMSKTSLSSALTFYNDKQMDKLQSEYKKDITTMEKKLQDMEDRYYKQFSAMEVAMQKLQSQSNYLASMLGTGN